VRLESCPHLQICCNAEITIALHISHKIYIGVNSAEECAIYENNRW
jgi:hypothetical protein